MRLVFIEHAKLQHILKSKFDYINFQTSRL